MRQVGRQLLELTEILQRAVRPADVLTSAHYGVLAGLPRRSALAPSDALHAGTTKSAEENPIEPEDERAALLGENARLKQMLAAAAEPDSSSRKSDTQMAAARAEAAKLAADNLKLRKALATGAPGMKAISM